MLNINFNFLKRYIFEKKSASASAALFGERERWFLGALVKLGEGVKITGEFF
jgi:hypothetical protein